MAELQSPQHPLEVLPAMLNLMLVQTGKFFKEAASNGPGDLVSARESLKEVGTSANRRFHEALDELEIECTRAKAVFERDLRKERAKRAERDRTAGILTRPAGVVKQRSPGAGTKKTLQRINEDAKTPDVKAHGLKMEEGVAQAVMQNIDKKVEDAVMVNGSDILEDPKTKQAVLETTELEVPTDKAVNDSLTRASFDASQVPNKIGNPPVVLKPDLATEKAPSPKILEPAADAAPKAADVSSLEPPSHTQEAAPFESMFNDVEQSTNINSLDFDLGFSTSQDLLNDPVFDNIDLSNTEEATNLTATSAEDINTLLPGLENYVNDGGDFSMIDFPPTTMPELTAATTNAPTESTTAGANNTGSAGQAAEMAPMESNFDDLFGSGDWAGDGDMGDGAMVDFDEDWFKTEG